MQNIKTYVNQDEALNRIRGNKELYKKLLQSFLKDSLMDRLVGELECGDIGAAAKSAHAIKGAAANLALTKLYEAVKHLEISLKAGACDEKALTACLNMFDKTKEAINDILNCDDSEKM